MIRVTWHGHATVSVESGNRHILIDPFFTGNPAAVADETSLNPDTIIVTHGHDDHVADVEAIAKRSGATLISSPEICGWFAGRGVGESHAMNIGGWTDFGQFRVKFTPAWHSSSLPDGSYAGMPMGVLLELGGRRVYHAGDTALFSDMSLIGREGVDLALLPIGSNFTMGPDEALEASRLLEPRLVIPIHYDTFPPIRQDAQSFAQRLEQETGTACRVMAAGEVIDL